MSEHQNISSMTGSTSQTWIEGPEKFGRPRLLLPTADAERVKRTWSEINSGLDRAEQARALIESLGDQVEKPTIRAIRAQLVSIGAGALAHQARKGDARILLTFAGQAQSYFADLENLFHVPRARDVIEACSAAITDELGKGAILEGLHPQGINLLDWLKNPASRPSDEALSSGVISQPLIFITQAAQLVALERFGFAPVQIADWATATAGHSQGIMSGLLAAEGLEHGALCQRAAQMTRYFVWQGIHMQSSWGQLPPANIEPAGATPMVAVTGLRSKALRAHIDSEKVSVALTNALDRMVISGPPNELKRICNRIEREFSAKFRSFENGQRARPQKVGLEWLAVSAPFHSPAMANAMEPLKAKAESLNLWPDPKTLKVPLLRGEDGQIWRGEDLVESQCVNPVNWPLVLDASRDFEITHVLDAGPDAGVSAVTAIGTRGYGIRVIAGATEDGEALLRASQLSDIAPPAAWSAYAPQAVAQPDGTIELENQFTKRTGFHPIFLPGMTPTTVDAPIVAAAANAGYLAELAGGGQPTEAIFRERATELLERLEPGAGYVVNTLYLDPYLWGLQIGKDRVVQKLRSEGHPIIGVTISAGIPPLDEALELMREFNALGMNFNALKVGNDDQVRQALAIADAYDGEFILQVEGGRAGGHHSYDELEQLLIAWYARIRRRSNLLLTVGGGIGSGERVCDFLTGSWSKKYGTAPMPVDAVYLGTALMAAKEATTAPKVKQLLVELDGAEHIVARGASSGGVRSGLSGLGADIHYADNHAARTAAMLDSVVGDSSAIEVRRAEIIEALSKTAKPYFGDIEKMSYADALGRTIELMAIGRSGRYEDGVWLDRSHRARYGKLLRRALSRCQYARELPTDSELSAPLPQLKTLVGSTPLLSTTPVLPEDVRYFVEKVCGPGGKPVPFIPVIDKNIRRWFSSDSLWQAHDDRYDPEAVLVIPGPTAVKGITCVDQPVAELMADFLAETIEGAGVPKRKENVDLEQLAMSSAVCLFGRKEVPNPISSIIESRIGEARLEPSANGVVLRIAHQLPTGGRNHLGLKFDVRPDLRLPLRAGATASEQLRSFYRAVMPEEVAIHPERVAAYRRVTGHNGPDFPEHLFFATALPAMMSILLQPELGLDPLSLLHLSSRIEVRPGELKAKSLSTEIMGFSVVDEPAGRRVTIQCAVKDAKRIAAELTQAFLIRSYEGEVSSAMQLPLSPRDENASEPVQLAQPRPLFDLTQSAPLDLTPFAHISGDLNPIHRDPALAILAGLPQPIVHGQWTSATASALLVGLTGRLSSCTSHFLAPVAPGALLRFKGEVTARRDGHEIIDVNVYADDTAVLHMRAERLSPATAIVFPGQGSQRKGMGMNAYGRSSAAREIWDRADQHTKQQYGFSLLEIVRNNPKSIDVGSTIVRHPEGVLNVTQFTQVALTVLSCAGVAEMREAGVFPEKAWFAGHSVGEYSALAAVTDVLPLEALIDVVYHRGLTMQRFVERDEQGRSDYAMGVIRPNRARMMGPDAVDLVDRIAEESGFPLHVVNHNVRHRQYAVAGHVQAITRLEARLLQKAPDGSAWVTIPGIDVPFHSPLLVDGVEAFRRVLNNCIPKDVDIPNLIGRYIPNLVARPFELTADFVDAIFEVTQYEPLRNMRKRPTTKGREILIELLAWQFASPVRWIETQDLFADNLQRLIEIGPGSAPVLTNMFHSGMRNRDDIPETLHSERDHRLVIGLGEVVDEVSEPAAPLAPLKEPDSVTVSVPVAATSSAGAADLEDAPWDIDQSLKALLALRIGKTISELGNSDTIDGLLGGNSAKRNQVLLDLGKEFGAGAVDGAHELALSELSDALSQSAGARYRHPGSCLKAAQTQVLNMLGLSRRQVDTQLVDEYGLQPGRREAVLTTLAVEFGSFEGASDPLEAAARKYASVAGISLERSAAPAAQSSGIDPAAIAAAEEKLQGQWQEIARAALKSGGLDPRLIDRALDTRPTPRIRAPRKSENGRFDAGKHVAFTTADLWAVADLYRAFWDLMRGENASWSSAQFEHRATPRLLQAVEALISAAGDRRDVKETLGAWRNAITAGICSTPTWSQETVLVTGAGPDSIAEAMVIELLAGGAKVIVTTSRLSKSRVSRFKGLYRAHGARDAELHVVPFDQGEFGDIDALCEWLCSSISETRGAERVELKGPWLPTLLIPFGAVPAEGDLTDINDDMAHGLRVNLLGVERLIGTLAQTLNRKGEDVTPMHVLLPLSPNHGQMGRDGLYAEAKIGLETLLLRWKSEYASWGRRTSICGARIGWVRGTGLMSGLDRVYEEVEEELGITTFSPKQMASLLLENCNHKARKLAQETPQVADLTGGFGTAKGLRDLINRALSVAQNTPPQDAAEDVVHLPRMLFDFPRLPESVKASDLDLSDAVVVVGFGEIGPFGNERVRWSMEKSSMLSPEAALELSWLCGCIRFEGAEWVDAESGEPVDVNTLVEDYDLEKRIGIRKLDAFDPSEVTSFSEVLLSEDMVFHVPDADIAETFRIQDPENTDIFHESDGGCRVVRRAGSRVRVPRRTPIDRDIAGQIPDGFDPTRLGFDAQQLEQIDPVGVYNLLTTAEAFRSAGLTPEELWAQVHPSRIACTQGSGIGGMRALRRLYADTLLDQNKQSDVLQETLINVVAAYSGMSYHGGYGSMIHPVAACATAAVSVEVASDLLRGGKADFVVAGAFDDLSREGARGFADMQATISIDDRNRKGLEPSQSSRPCDARRGGFVEAQGGGTILLCRAKTALKMGLPIYGVVGGAWSCGDGLQRSVPAPGPGLLSIAAGGITSPLGSALNKVGLKADDVGVISMHGTSTHANDRNETALHRNLASALGRSEGLPLPVIAQKALTGHCKGGAAAWQMIGLMQAMNDSVIPGMPNLDEPDRAVADRGDLIFSDRPITMKPGAIRAGLVTSLGFGHVGAAVFLAHADVLLESLDSATLGAYAERRKQRWAKRMTSQARVLLSEASFFEERAEKPVSSADEEKLLLDPQARIS